MSKPTFRRRGSDSDPGYPPKGRDERVSPGELRGDEGGVELPVPRSGEVGRTKTGLHGAGPSTETLRYGAEEPEAYDEDGSHDEIGAGRPENANTEQFGRDSETDEWHTSDSHPKNRVRGHSGVGGGMGGPEADFVDRGEGYRGRGRGLLP